MAQYYTLVTDIGTKKIAEMIATGSKLNLVKLQLGDGGGAYYEPSTKQTALKNKVHEINVNSIKTNAENQNWLTIEGVVEAKVGGFYIREVGLFDDSNQLIAIAKYSETYKPLPSEGTAKELVIRVVIDIDNVDSINMSVNADISVATKDDIKNLEDDINELETKIDSIKINNNFQTATGTGAEITIDIDMNTIQNGDSFTFIASANNAGSATTINGKPVYKPNTTTPPNTTSGKAYTIWYNAPSDCFFVQASAEGNAHQSSVLAGATFSNDNDTGLVGTMRNNNNKISDWCHFENITVQPHPTDSSQGLVTIPMAVAPEINSGYYGSGSKIQANIASLNAGNIKAGVKVGRSDGSSANCITGTFTNDATAQAGHIISGQSAYVKGNKINGNMPNLAGQTVYGGAEGVKTVQIYPSNTGFLQVINTPSPNSKPYGYIDYTTKLENHIPLNILASALGITANKIVSGQNIAGVWGNATVESMGGKRFTSGTVNVGSAYHTVVNVGFNPNLIFTLHGNYISVTFNNLFGGNSLMVTNISRYNTGYRPSVTVEAPPTVAGKTTNATAFPVGNNSICVTMGVSGAYDVSYWALQI